MIEGSPKESGESATLQTVACASLLLRDEREMPLLAHGFEALKRLGRFAEFSMARHLAKEEQRLSTKSTKERLAGCDDKSKPYDSAQ